MDSCLRSALRGAWPTAVLASLAAAWLTACGGGDDGTEYEQLVAQAQALRAQSVALVQAGPCSDDSQCTGLAFGATQYSCTPYDQVSYTKLSAATAQAEQLAQQQRDMARRALSLAPPPDFACTAQYIPPPRHVCEQQRCVQRSAGVDIIVLPGS